MWLSRIGLRRTITDSDGAELRLPNNTIAGFRDGCSNAEEVIADVRNTFQSFAVWDSGQGRVLVTASREDTTEFRRFEFRQ